MKTSKLSILLRSWAKRWSQIDKIVLVLFVATFILVFPAFFPNLSEISPWDEGAYINSGRMLVERGEWPIFAFSPLSSALYALTYLPYHSSPFWLIQSCSLGRLVLFVLIWLSTYLVASQLRKFAHPGVALGLFLLAPWTIEMLTFPSDPLFAAMAGLALWKLLSFYNTGEVKHVWLASLFLGLASLARNDGLILFPVFIILSIVLGRRYQNAMRVVIASIAPFVILIGAYVLFYGLRTGNFSLGTMERTYNNFESGQEIVGSGDYGVNPVVGSQLEAWRYFGTAEENHFSVFRAIQRNPEMYLTRLKIAIQRFPDAAMHAYGIRFAPLLLLFGIRGAVELIRKKQALLLIILLLWSLPLASGFVITLFRSGHMLFPFYIVLGLAAIGLAALVGGIQGRERYFWVGILLAMAAAGLAFNKLAVFYAAIVFLLGLWAVYEIMRTHPLSGRFSWSCVLLLCAGLVIRGNFPSPKVRVLGQEPQEQAVVALAQALPEGSLVAAGSQTSVYMARMELANLTATDIPRDATPEQFLAWMRSQKIDAIFVDPSLYHDNPLIWSMIEPKIGTGLERIFSIDGGNIQILLVTYP